MENKTFVYVIEDPTGDRYSDIFESLEDAQKHLKEAAENSKIYRIETTDNTIGEPLEDFKRYINGRIGRSNLQNKEL